MPLSLQQGTPVTRMIRMNEYQINQKDSNTLQLKNLKGVAKWRSNIEIIT